MWFSIGNQRGDSLIAVMISMALSGLVLSATAATMNQMMKNASIYTARVQATDELSAFKEVFKTGAACTKNLENLTLPALAVPPAEQQTLAVNTIRALDAAGNLSNILAAVSQELANKMSISHMDLIPRQQGVSSGGFENYSVDLRIVYAGLNGPPMPRYAKLQMQIEPGTRIIRGCTVAGEGSGSGNGSLPICPSKPYYPMQQCDPSHPAYNPEFCASGTLPEGVLTQTHMLIPHGQQCECRVVAYGQSGPSADWVCINTAPENPPGGP